MFSFQGGIQLTECTEVTKHSLSLPGFSDGNKGPTDGIVFMHPGVQYDKKKRSQKCLPNMLNPLLQGCSIQDQILPS